MNSSCNVQGAFLFRKRSINFIRKDKPSIDRN
jgi:hypothetical protein